MDCRKFHRDLEDYLEDGLDFSSRFGVERHAQQCIHCGKVLSNAQQLRRMTRQIEKVKAPSEGANHRAVFWGLDGSGFMAFNCRRCGDWPRQLLVWPFWALALSI
jgi:hypothetical protein